VRLFIGVFLTLGALAAANAQANNPPDDSVHIYAVEMLQGSEQRVAGAGIFLGKGLVITAAHVAGPDHAGVRIDGVNLPANMIKRGTFETADLALFSVEEETLPISYRLLGLPLCQTPPRVSAPVIVVAPQGSTRARIASPLLLPPIDRTRWSTLIDDVETSGKSGSGVFDAEKKCLLGILSAKITNNVEHKDIGTFFVSASTIQSFVPDWARW
jgi:hypothetical protein